MALATRELELVLIAKNRASSVIARVGGALAGLSRQAGLVGAAGAAAMGVMINEAAHFQQQNALIFTQVEGVADATFRSIEAAAKKVGRNIPVELEQIQSAFYDLFSTVDVANMDEAEKVVSQFARAAVVGQAPIEDIARNTIAWVNALDEVLDADNVRRHLNIQFEMVRKGAGTYAEMTAEVGKAIPAFVKANQSAETFAGTMAFLTRRGLNPAFAATSAARSVELLFGRKAVEGLKAYNISLSDAEGNTRHMLDILKEIAPLFEGKPIEERTTLFYDIFGQGRIQARRFFDTVLPNIQAYEAMLKEIDEAVSEDVLTEYYKFMEEQPLSQIQQLQNHFKLLRIEIGQALWQDVAKYALPAIKKLFSAWEGLPQAQKQAISQMFLFGTALAFVVAIGAGLLSFMVLAIGVLSAFPVTVGLAVLALGALGKAMLGLVPAIVKNWSGVKDAIVRTISASIDAWDSGTRNLIPIWRTGLREIVRELDLWTPEVESKWTAAYDRWFSPFVDAYNDTFGRVKEFIINDAGDIDQIYSDLIKKLAPSFVGLGGLLFGGPFTKALGAGVVLSQIREIGPAVREWWQSGGKEDVTGLFSGIWGDINLSLRKNFGWDLTSFEGLWGEVVSVVEQAISFISNLAGRILSIVGGLIGVDESVLDDIMNEDWDAAIQKVVDPIKAILSGLSGILGTLASALAGDKGALQENIGKLDAALSFIGPNIVSGVFTIIRAGLDAVGLLFSGGDTGTKLNFPKMILEEVQYQVKLTLSKIPLLEHFIDEPTRHRIFGDGSPSLVSLAEGEGPTTKPPYRESVSSEIPSLFPTATPPELTPTETPPNVPIGDVAGGTGLLGNILTLGGILGAGWLGTAKSGIFGGLGRGALSGGLKGFGLGYLLETLFDTDLPVEWMTLGGAAIGAGGGARKIWNARSQQSDDVLRANLRRMGLKVPFGVDPKNASTGWDRIRAAFRSSDMSPTAQILSEGFSTARRGAGAGFRGFGRGIGWAGSSLWRGVRSTFGSAGSAWAQTEWPRIFQNFMRGMKNFSERIWRFGRRPTGGSSAWSGAGSWDEGFWDWQRTRPSPGAGAGPKWGGDLRGWQGATFDSRAAGSWSRPTPPPPPQPPPGPEPYTAKWYRQRGANIPGRGGGGAGPGKYWQGFTYRPGGQSFHTLGQAYYGTAQELWGYAPDDLVASKNYARFEGGTMTRTTRPPPYRFPSEYEIARARQAAWNKAYVGREWMQPGYKGDTFWKTWAQEQKQTYGGLYDGPQGAGGRRTGLGRNPLTGPTRPDAVPDAILNQRAWAARWATLGRVGKFAGKALGPVGLAVDLGLAIKELPQISAAVEDITGLESGLATTGGLSVSSTGLVTGISAPSPNITDIGTGLVAPFWPLLAGAPDTPRQDILRVEAKRLEEEYAELLTAPISTATSPAWTRSAVTPTQARFDELEGIRDRLDELDRIINREYYERLAYAEHVIDRSNALIEEQLEKELRKEEIAARVEFGNLVDQVVEMQEVRTDQMGWQALEARKLARTAYSPISTEQWHEQQRVRTVDAYANLILEAMHNQRALNGEIREFIKFQLASNPNIQALIELADGVGGAQYSTGNLQQIIGTLTSGSITIEELDESGIKTSALDSITRILSGRGDTAEEYRAAIDLFQSGIITSQDVEESGLADLITESLHTADFSLMGEVLRSGIIQNIDPDGEIVAKIVRVTTGWGQGTEGYTVAELNRIKDIFLTWNLPEGWMTDDIKKGIISFFTGIEGVLSTDNLNYLASFIRAGILGSDDFDVGTELGDKIQEAIDSWDLTSLGSSIEQKTAVLRQMIARGLIGEQTARDALTVDYPFEFYGDLGTPGDTELDAAAGNIVTLFQSGMTQPLLTLFENTFTELGTDATEGIKSLNDDIDEVIEALDPFGEITSSMDTMVNDVDLGFFQLIEDTEGNLKTLHEKVSEWTPRIVSWLNLLNPLERRSPSLVDKTRKGYKDLLGIVTNFYREYDPLIRNITDNSFLSLYQSETETISSFESWWERLIRVGREYGSILADVILAALDPTVRRSPSVVDRMKAGHKEALDEMSNFSKAAQDASPWPTSKSSAWPGQEPVPPKIVSAYPHQIFSDAPINPEKDYVRTTQRVLNPVERSATGYNHLTTTHRDYVIDPDFNFRYHRTRRLYEGPGRSPYWEQTKIGVGDVGFREVNDPGRAAATGSIFKKYGYLEGKNAYQTQRTAYRGPANHFYDSYVDTELLDFFGRPPGVTKTQSNFYSHPAIKKGSFLRYDSDNPYSVYGSPFPSAEYGEPNMKASFKPKPPAWPGGGSIPPKIFSPWWMRDSDAPKESYDIRRSERFLNPIERAATGFSTVTTEADSEMKGAHIGSGFPHNFVRYLTTKKQYNAPGRYPYFELINRGDQYDKRSQHFIESTTAYQNTRTNFVDRFTSLDSALAGGIQLRDWLSDSVYAGKRRGTPTLEHITEMPPEIPNLPYSSFDDGIREASIKGTISNEFDAELSRTYDTVRTWVPQITSIMSRLNPTERMSPSLVDKTKKGYKELEDILLRYTRNTTPIVKGIGETTTSVFDEMQYDVLDTMDTIAQDSPRALKRTLDDIDYLLSQGVGEFEGEVPVELSEDAIQGIIDAIDNITIPTISIPSEIETPEPPVLPDIHPGELDVDIPINVKYIHYSTEFPPPIKPPVPSTGGIWGLEEETTHGTENPFEVDVNIPMNYNFSRGRTGNPPPIPEPPPGSTTRSIVVDIRYVNGEIIVTPVPPALPDATITRTVTIEYIYQDESGTPTPEFGEGNSNPGPGPSPGPAGNPGSGPAGSPTNTGTGKGTGIPIGNEFGETGVIKPEFSGKAVPTGYVPTRAIPPSVRAIIDAINAGKNINKTASQFGGYNYNGKLFPSWQQKIIEEALAHQRRLGAAAEGAIVHRPMLSLVGEAGPEAIVPLHKLQGADPLPTRLDSMIGGSGDTINSNNTTYEQHFTVNGADARELAEEIAWKVRMT